MNLLAEFINLSIQFSALVLSAAIAYRFKYFGFFVGVIAIWSFGILRFELLMMADPHYSPGISGAAWMGVGWIVGAIWCFPFALAKIVVLYYQKRKLSTIA